MHALEVTDPGVHLDLPAGTMPVDLSLSLSPWASTTGVPQSRAVTIHDVGLPVGHVNQPPTGQPRRRLRHPLVPLAPAQTLAHASTLAVAILGLAITLGRPDRRGIACRAPGPHPPPVLAGRRAGFVDLGPLTKASTGPTANVPGSLRLRLDLGGGVVLQISRP
jgi:hypothetical protein